MRSLGAVPVRGGPVWLRRRPRRHASDDRDKARSATLQRDSRTKEGLRRGGQELAAANRASQELRAPTHHEAFGKLSHRKEVFKDYSKTHKEQAGVMVFGCAEMSNYAVPEKCGAASH